MASDQFWQLLSDITFADAEVTGEYVSASRTWPSGSIIVRRRLDQYGGHRRSALPCPVLPATVRHHPGRHGQGGGRHGLGPVSTIDVRRALDRLGGHGGERHGLSSVLSITVRRHRQRQEGHRREHHGLALDLGRAEGVDRGARYGPASAVTRKVKTSGTDESGSALGSVCHSLSDVTLTSAEVMEERVPRPWLRTSAIARRHLHRHGGRGRE